MRHHMYNIIMIVLRVFRVCIAAMFIQKKKTKNYPRTKMEVGLSVCMVWYVRTHNIESRVLNRLIILKLFSNSKMVYLYRIHGRFVELIVILKMN